jgi:hypothetical protein
MLGRSCRRRKAAQSLGRGGLGHENSGQDEGAPAPPREPDPVVREQVAEEPGPDRLEREDERDPNASVVRRAGSGLFGSVSRDDASAPRETSPEGTVGRPRAHD